VLFDGKDLSQWVQLKPWSPLSESTKPAAWKVANGYMEVVAGTGNILTKQHFGDAQIHVEFWLPLMADQKGQYRANSGVYIQGCYEIQVLDSYGLKTADTGCGGIYDTAIPLVNACRPPKQWQTYDIFFRAPRFDDKGKKTANARVTVLQNGVMIHDDVELIDGTAGAACGESSTGPLMLQDHANPVRYRNIWIRPLAMPQPKAGS